MSFTPNEIHNAFQVDNETDVYDYYNEVEPDNDIVFDDDDIMECDICGSQFDLAVHDIEIMVEHLQEHGITVKNPFGNEVLQLMQSQWSDIKGVMEPTDDALRELESVATNYDLDNDTISRVEKAIEYQSYATEDVVDDINQTMRSGVSDSQLDQIIDLLDLDEDSYDPAENNEDGEWDNTSPMTSHDWIKIIADSGGYLDRGGGDEVLHDIARVLGIESYAREESFREFPPTVPDGKKVCPTCNGTGEVNADGTSISSFGNEGGIFKCDRCFGFGLIDDNPTEYSGVNKIDEYYAREEYTDPECMICGKVMHNSFEQNDDQEAIKNAIARHYEDYHADIEENFKLIDIEIEKQLAKTTYNPKHANAYLTGTGLNESHAKEMALTHWEYEEGKQMWDEDYRDNRGDFEGVDQNKDWDDLDPQWQEDYYRGYQSTNAGNISNQDLTDQGYTSDKYPIAHDEGDMFDKNPTESYAKEMEEAKMWWDSMSEQERIDNGYWETDYEELKTDLDYDQQSPSGSRYVDTLYTSSFLKSQGIDDATIEDVSYDDQPNPIQDIDIWGESYATEDMVDEARVWWDSLSQAEREGWSIDSVSDVIDQQRVNTAGNDLSYDLLPQEAQQDVNTIFRMEVVGNQVPELQSELGGNQFYDDQPNPLGTNKDAWGVGWLDEGPANYPMTEEGTDPFPYEEEEMPKTIRDELKDKESAQVEPDPHWNAGRWTSGKGSLEDMYADEEEDLALQLDSTKLDNRSRFEESK